MSMTGNVMDNHIGIMNNTVYTQFNDVQCIQIPEAMVIALRTIYFSVD